MDGEIDKNSYLRTNFSLYLSNIDHITDQLKMLGKGCHLNNIDISRVLEHTKVDPMDYYLLSLLMSIIVSHLSADTGRKFSSAAVMVSISCHVNKADRCFDPLAQVQRHQRHE